MPCPGIITGKDIFVFAADLNATCTPVTLPTGQRTNSIEIDATTPIAVSSTVTSITLSNALPTGVYLPKDTFIEVNAAGSGAIVLLQLNATANAGDTTISVKAVPRAIPDSSTFTYPCQVGSFRGATVTPQGNRVNSFRAGGSGKSAGRVTTLETSVTISVDNDDLDAAQNILRQASNAVGKYVYLWVYMPAPADDYSRGWVWDGVCSITGFPHGGTADQILQADIAAVLEGDYNALPPVAA